MAIRNVYSAIDVLNLKIKHNRNRIAVLELDMQETQKELDGFLQEITDLEDEIKNFKEAIPKLKAK